MKWIACLLAFACQAGEARQAPAPAQSAASSSGGSKIVQLPKAPVTDAYRSDIATLCDVVHLSDADQQPKNERWPIIAMYLGPHIKTSEAHDFLVRNSERFGAGLATHGLDVGRFQVDVQTQGREHHRDGSAWSRGEGPRHADEPSRSLDNEWQPQQRPLMEWDHRMVNLFA